MARPAGRIGPDQSVAGRDPELIEIADRVAYLADDGGQLADARSSGGRIGGHLQRIPQRPQSVLHVRDLITRHDHRIGIQTSPVGLPACLVGALPMRGTAENTRPTDAQRGQRFAAPGAAPRFGLIGSHDGKLTDIRCRDGQVAAVSCLFGRLAESGGALCPFCWLRTLKCLLGKGFSGRCTVPPGLPRHG